MSIEDFIEDVCVQDAVYWGNPVPDGEGGMTFDDPVEIKCRWDNTIKVITGNNGVQIVCVAEVLITQDLDEQGMLYLGTLDDIDSDMHDDPKGIGGVYPIKVFTKTPMIKSTDEFVRKAYL